MNQKIKKVADEILAAIEKNPFSETTSGTIEAINSLKDAISSNHQLREKLTPEERKRFEEIMKKLTEIK